jgi:hypothetical protein
MVSLTMTRVFNTPYGESALYSCAKITALTDIISFFASSQVVTVLLRVRGLVARLKVRSAVVFFSRATLLSCDACGVIHYSLVKQPTAKLVVTVARREIIHVCSMVCSK